jgi:hypothetical protein
VGTNDPFRPGYSPTRRMPFGTRLSHARPYGPFDTFEAWLEWARSNPGRAGRSGNTGRD